MYVTCILYSLFSIVNTNKLSFVSILQIKEYLQNIIYIYIYMCVCVCVCMYVCVFCTFVGIDNKM